MEMHIWLMQPAVIELLLFPNEHSEATSAGTCTTSLRQPSTSSAHEDGSTEGLDMLWDLLLNSSELVKRFVLFPSSCDLFFSASSRKISMTITRSIVSELLTSVTPLQTCVLKSTS